MNNNRSKMCCKRGFTLIELLVVVIVVGILAAVAVPQYQVAVEKSRLGVLMSNVKTAKNALELYYLANGQYPEEESWEGVEFEVSGCSQSTEDKNLILCLDSTYYQYNKGSLVHGVTKKMTVYTQYLDHSTHPGRQ